MTPEDRIAQLTGIVERLERRSRRANIAFASAIGVAILGLLFQPTMKPAVAAATTGATPVADSILTIRELVIVDAMGTPRVRIGAPLPDPIMLGKRFNRGGVVSGILIYDAEGNERGGYVTGDESRGAALTLDSETVAPCSARPLSFRGDRVASVPWLQIPNE